MLNPPWQANVPNAAQISPLFQTELNSYNFSNNKVSDISPLAGLTNLKAIFSWGNSISDFSPLGRLTKPNVVNICGTELSDLTPLAGLKNLKELYLRSNNISDISPLAGLTDLKWLAVNQNKISDLSPLDGLRENVKLIWHENPAFPKGGPKIEGPWLWIVLPNTKLDSGTDLLSEASGGIVTEAEIATKGATVGKSVGDDVWTAHKLPPAGWDNVERMLQGRIDGAIVYGTVSLHSLQEQETTMYVGSQHGFKVWFNGTLIYESLRYHASEDYTDFFPVTLEQGRNVLLVAVESQKNAFFGFESGTKYTVANPGVGYAFSETPIHVGDTFTFDIRAENVFDLAGWQFDIGFDPAALEAVDVSEGDFLATDGGATFFQSGRIDNAAGKITELKSALLSDRGMNGSGTILQVRFKAKSDGETSLVLENFLFGSFTGENIPAGPHEIHITVKERLLTGDVNRDEVVNILDLILVARQLGKSVPSDSPVDINGDGVVNIFDLTLVAQGIGGAAAPAPGVAISTTIESWIVQARLVDDGSIAFRQAIANLQNLLASLIPQETALHANYPNPFNPET